MIMKKRTIAALTVAVWFAAIGSAAALTYELNRPLTLRDTPPLEEGPRIVATVEPAAPLPKPAPTLVVPTITIVAAPRHFAVAPRVRALPDISRMQCKDWQDLQMGSGRVRVCQ
jgi:hypothetical protein